MDRVYGEVLSGVERRRVEDQGPDQDRRINPAYSPSHRVYIALHV